MSQTELLLLGAGGHARACIEAVEGDGRYRIAGLVGTPDEVGSSVLGYPVLGSDADLAELARRFGHALVALGQIGSPAARIRLDRQARALGFCMAVIVARGARVSRHARLGSGTLVLHGALVNAGARVGANCIINSGAIIEHDAEVGDDCHVATGAILNGAVRLGAGSFVGSGSVIKQGLVLGQQCVIGMGQSVRHEVAAHARLPARTPP